jgi:hypothetical protein
MPSESIDLVVTDPPYLVNYTPVTGAGAPMQSAIHPDRQCLATLLDRHQPGGCLVDA